MSESANLISRYYQASLGRKLDKVVSLVDASTELAARVLESDFLAIFVKHETNDRLIPIGYHGVVGKAVENLGDLEQAWASHTAEPSKKLRRVSDSVGDPQQGALADKFAAHNNLHWTFQYPLYHQGLYRGVVVGFWHRRPTFNDRVLSPQLAVIGDILFGVMSTFSDIRTDDSYSIRLSELLSLYELPVKQERFKDLVSALVRRSLTLVNADGCCLMSADSLTGRLQPGESFGVQPPGSALLETMIELLQEQINAVRRPEQRVIDLSWRFSNELGASVALLIEPEPDRIFVIILWSRQRTDFSPTDFELLAVYGMFAEVMLRNALLIRSLRHANRQLKGSAEKMANVETLAALADMTSGVAHEFNNLIGGVVGRVQILQTQIDNEHVLKALGSIEKQMLDGADTVRRIQEFTTSARYKKLSDVDLRSVVQSCLKNDRAAFFTRAEERGIKIKSSLEPDPITISGCQEDLATSLEKLLDNAVDHAPDNSTVEVELTSDDRHIFLTVRDHGGGIPDKIRNRIFNPFFSTKSTKAAGLGLSIVHGIVTRHGGNLTFECDRETGTVFSIQFDKPAVEAEITEISRKTTSKSKLKVLIVDDDDQIRDVLAEMLKIDGHQTVACEDGFKALDTLEQSTFDVMITDLGMPGMSGLELAGTAHEKYPEMGIAMITGWGAQLDANEVAIRGIQAILNKPFHLRDIKATLNEIAMR